MVNYDDLPLFPLHTVLYPKIPMPLHIFEPRYREMIWRCLDQNASFGIALIQDGAETGQAALPCSVGTTACITQFDEMPDGRLNIVVVGETRFRIWETRQDHPYLSARVAPFAEQARDAVSLPSAVDSVASLFRTYIKSLLARTGQTLSLLQLPHEPEYLSYAVAHSLQIALPEKQELLEIVDTEPRLRREIDILKQEIEACSLLPPRLRNIPTPEKELVPANTQELGKLSSLN